MKIKWNGHASFTITSDKGIVIVTDPYDPSGYGGILKYDPVTDRADGVLISHDHADHNYADSLSGSPEVLKGSGEIKGIQVKAIQTYHDESGGSERIKAIGPVDILLVPVGGTYTLDADGAVRVVNSLRPKVAIPMHFKTEKCDLPIAGVEGFLEKMDKVKELGVSEIEISSGRG
ncbi:MAG: MBL fold metallo-hydrolase [Deltaproteobacteria bacterium]|nr:MBL fold metallo-hydrolase [Deltaproteobacteria bacterium]